MKIGRFVGFFGSVLVLAIGFVALMAPSSTLVIGCGDLANSLGGSCSTYQNDFSSAVSREGELSEDIGVDGPYPMALVLSQDGLNRIFAAISDADLPPIELSQTFLGVPVGLTLSPELPLFQIGGELDCPTCLLTDMGFGIGLSISGSEVTGLGSGRYQFPLALEANGLESTRLMANLGQSTLLDLNLEVSGVDNALMDLIEPWIADTATFFIQENLGNTHLFDLEAWSIGDGDVKMLGRGPIIEPDFGTIVLGIHTNLVRPLDGAVEVDPALPEGADIGMQFHPELIGTMLQRMMHEGHIARTYDEGGNAQPQGNHQITLNDMTSSTNLLQTGFTLWRTGGGLCGFAGLQADLGLSIRDAELALAVDNVQVVDGGGVGNLLVSASDWLGSAFLEDVVNFSELTINYREFALPEDRTAEMSATSFALDIDGRGLSVFLNIDNIVDPE